MSDEAARPDPDALLASIKKESAAAKRGRLKVFFGMCPGVGKTYAMLQAAQQKQKQGVEVVVGVVETHGRKETEALLEGLAILPRAHLEYKGTMLDEMDLDALVLWHPPLVVVDELAHTNAPGSRHPKRYQDVLELLDAGIDVFTPVNVQHLESRADTVWQITGAQVRETVPDSVLDLADEIILVDLTPEQLRIRLEEGRVYLGDRAARAAEGFFKESNLTALDAGADDYVTKPFSTAELLARLRAAQRKTRPAEEASVFTGGGLTVDLTARVVTRDRREIKLSATEYNLLRLFVRHAGRVLTHRQILREVWRPKSEEHRQYLRVYVTHLRAKIERDAANPVLIKTEPGIGYRFAAAPPLLRP